MPHVKVHELKIDAEYYMAVQAGNKKVELRYNDRNYEVGDIIRLRNPDADNALDLLITHVLQYEPALKDGWVAISFDVITPLDHRYSFMKDQLNVRKEQPPNDPTRD
jgi:ASC-1-like (ASCH) protein